MVHARLSAGRLSLQRDLDRDQNNHVDNLHDDKIEHKIGRDFRSLSHHTGMVHLHSGMEHLNNVDVEVSTAPSS